MSTLLAKRFFRNWKGTDAAGNEVELAEACLCEASSLILFESKGVWLPDLASANPEQYQAPGEIAGSIEKGSDDGNQAKWFTAFPQGTG